MDPLGDLFSFINTNVLKEEERVKKFLKDNGKNFETKKLKIKKRCKLCEVGEIHDILFSQNERTNDPRLIDFLALDTTRESLDTLLIDS